ncbi:3293_t:CDS:2 [Ambispora gerdemannii]|uniref:3293_t:CDS:1 n=1 Tax=Ambispora gerdemannii TaxID=144530 RepID=A0A9N9AAW5_9GLOM|nr:3293_t:CDS:2 [Ambispora gerdemannii]
MHSAPTHQLLGIDTNTTSHASNDVNTLIQQPWAVILSCIFGGALFYLLITLMHLCVYTYYLRKRLLMITTTACGFGILRLFLGLYDFATPQIQTTQKTVLFICANVIAFGLSDTVLYLRAAPFSKYPLITRAAWILTSIIKIILFSIVDEPRMAMSSQVYALSIENRRIVFNAVYDTLTIVYYAYISWVFIEHLRERGLLTTGHVYGPTNDHAVKFRRLLHVSIAYGLLGMGVVTLTRFLRAVLSSDSSCLMLGLAVAAEVCIVPCMIKTEIASKKSGIGIGLLNDGRGNDEKHLSEAASILKLRSIFFGHGNNRHRVNIDSFDEQIDDNSIPNNIVAGTDDDIRNSRDSNNNHPRNLIISLGSSIIASEDHNHSRNQSLLLSPNTVSTTPTTDSPPDTNSHIIIHLTPPVSLERQSKFDDGS